jgi:hypothetical protein
VGHPVGHPTENPGVEQWIAEIAGQRLIEMPRERPRHPEAQQHESGSYDELSRSLHGSAQMVA